MTGSPSVVLDASALLAYLMAEPGAEEVKRALTRIAAIGTVNYAEVLSKISDAGQDVDKAADRLTQHGLTGTALLVLPLDEPQAREIARLRRQTRAKALPLGDRACLALGRALGLPVLTADRLWQSLKLGVEVRLIR